MDAGPTRYNRFVERRPCRAHEDYDAAQTIGKDMSTRAGLVPTDWPPAHPALRSQLLAFAALPNQYALGSYAHTRALARCGRGAPSWINAATGGARHAHCAQGEV